MFTWGEGDEEDAKPKNDSGIRRNVHTNIKFLHFSHQRLRTSTITP